MSLRCEFDTGCKFLEHYWPRRCKPRTLILMSAFPASASTLIFADDIKAQGLTTILREKLKSCLTSFIAAAAQRFVGTLARIQAPPVGQMFRLQPVQILAVTGGGAKGGVVEDGHGLAARRFSVMEPVGQRGGVPEEAGFRFAPAAGAARRVPAFVIRPRSGQGFPFPN